MDAGSAAAAAVDFELVSLAHALADAAAEVTRRYFRTPVAVDAKQDASPVTIADREAEAAMREVLRSSCPDHGIFGEEQGYLAGGAGSEFLWVLDPIDGTKSFITGRARRPCCQCSSWRQDCCCGIPRLAPSCRRKTVPHAHRTLPRTLPHPTVQASRCSAPWWRCCTAASPCSAS